MAFCSPQVARHRKSFQPSPNSVMIRDLDFNSSGTLRPTNSSPESNDDKDSKTCPRPRKSSSLDAIERPSGKTYSPLSSSILSKRESSSKSTPYSKLGADSDLLGLLDEFSISGDYLLTPDSTIVKQPRQEVKQPRQEVTTTVSFDNAPVMPRRSSDPVLSPTRRCSDTDIPQSRRSSDPVLVPSPVPFGRWSEQATEEGIKPGAAAAKIDPPPQGKRRRGKKKLEGMILTCSSPVDTGMESDLTKTDLEDSSEENDISPPTLLNADNNASQLQTPEFRIPSQRPTIAENLLFIQYADHNVLPRSTSAPYRHFRSSSESLPLHGARSLLPEFNSEAMRSPASLRTPKTTTRRVRSATGQPPEHVRSGRGELRWNVDTPNRRASVDEILTTPRRSNCQTGTIFSSSETSSSDGVPQRTRAHSASDHAFGGGSSPFKKFQTTGRTTEEVSSETCVARESIHARLQRMAEHGHQLPVAPSLAKVATLKEETIGMDPSAIRLDTCQPSRLATSDMRKQPPIYSKNSPPSKPLNLPHCESSDNSNDKIPP